jgi:hypothetical protein
VVSRSNLPEKPLSIALGGVEWLDIGGGKLEPEKEKKDLIMDDGVKIERSFEGIFPLYKKALEENKYLKIEIEKLKMDANATSKTDNPCVNTIEPTNEAQELPVDWDKMGKMDRLKWLTANK